MKSFNQGRDSPMRSSSKRSQKWESGFLAIASLAGGEEVVSDVEHVDADLFAHIEEHNRNARP
jgi:hypothetical protein